MAASSGCRAASKVSSRPSLVPRRRLAPPSVDEDATHRRLQDLLLSKGAREDAGEELVLPFMPAGNSRSGSKNTGASGGHSSAVPEKRLTAAQLQQQQMELEEARRQFVEKVCAETTRGDVQNWIGRVYDMMHRARLAEQEANAKERRRRRARMSGAALSDAGVSGVSGNTGQTGETGHSSATGTALLTAGGSIATSRSYRGSGMPGVVAGVSITSAGVGLGARSVASEESLVVHHNGAEEPLNLKERVQAYLARRIPALELHVNAVVSARAEALQREVDEELADQFMLQTAQRKVFSTHANYLRWQNMRHQVLQKRINADMPAWIVEAIQGWDPAGALEKPGQKDLPDTDVVYNYLTKRSANIDHGKLPSEIPIFKALHASYSLPAMWRDKY